MHSDIRQPKSRQVPEVRHGFAAGGHSVRHPPTHDEQPLHLIIMAGAMIALMAAVMMIR